MAEVVALLVYLHELLVYVFYFFQVLKPIINDQDECTSPLSNDQKWSITIISISADLVIRSGNNSY